MSNKENVHDVYNTDNVKITTLIVTDSDSSNDTSNMPPKQSLASGKKMSGTTKGKTANVPTSVASASKDASSKTATTKVIKSTGQPVSVSTVTQTPAITTQTELIQSVKSVVSNLIGTNQSPTKTVSTPSALGMLKGLPSRTSSNPDEKPLKTSTPTRLDPDPNLTERKYAWDIPSKDPIQHHQDAYVTDKTLDDDPDMFTLHGTPNVPGVMTTTRSSKTTPSAAAGAPPKNNDGNRKSSTSYKQDNDWLSTTDDEDDKDKNNARRTSRTNKKGFLDGSDRYSKVRSSHYTNDANKPNVHETNTMHENVYAHDIHDHRFKENYAPIPSIRPRSKSPPYFEALVNHK